MKPDAPHTINLFDWTPPERHALERAPAQEPKTFALRPYQTAAAQAGKDFFRAPQPGRNGVIVLPTGAGKSLVIADIATASQGHTLILQPSKEILEQNFRKIVLSGCRDVGIFSAAFNSRAIKKITLATIGSIINRKELFEHFSQIIIDECDVVNPKEGQYKDFFEHIGKPVLGLTASPWRLHGGGVIGTRELPNGHVLDIFSGSVNKMLTRTRPRFFTDILHVTQIGELYDAGYLCPVEYRESAFDERQLILNSTGADYKDATYKKISKDVIRDAFSAVQKAIGREEVKHNLVFVGRVEDAETLVKMYANVGIMAAAVSGTTAPAKRSSILSKFMAGDIHAVVNVGVLTVGFDFPALDHIVLGRPTNSARLYYQMLGRGIRPLPSKSRCVLTDLCGNVNRFGKIENWVIDDPDCNGKWRLRCGDKFLTGTDLKTGDDLEKPKEAAYCNRPKFNAKTVWKIGKYKDYPLDLVHTHYLKWFVQNTGPSEHRKVAMDELAKRSELTTPEGVL